MRQQLKGAKITIKVDIKLQMDQNINIKDLKFVHVATNQ